MALGTYTLNPSSSNVTFGRGRLFLSPLGADNLPMGGFRDVGRISSLQLDISTETVEYTSFYNCQPVTDVEIVSDTSLSLSVNLDEGTAQNLAIFLGGEATEGAPGSGVPVSTGTPIVGASIELAAETDFGGWFPINDANGNRLLSIDAGGTFEFSYAGAPLAQSDYEIDLPQGLVRIRTNVSLTEGQPLTLTAFTPAAGATDKNLDITSAFTLGTQAFAAEVKIFSGQDCSETLVKIYRLLIRPNGQLSLIDNEASSLPLEGTMSANPVGHIQGGLSDFFDVVPLSTAA